MSNRCVCRRRGALAGLALFLAYGAAADESLRERVHREHKHESYMLIEDASGARLFLFGEGIVAVQDAARDETVIAALEKTRSDDARMRVRGLVELAGVSDAAALDVALALLNDPDHAVRDEARQLILDHPDGTATAEAIGLIDEELAD